MLCLFLKDKTQNAASFKLVVENKFLGTKDLGRLLLFTCKRLTSDIYSPQDVWQCLCANEWSANDVDVATKRSGMTHQDMFRKLLVPTLNRESQEPCRLRPLKYSPEDYLFVFKVSRKQAEQPFYHKVVPGEALSEFFEDGCRRVEFDEMIWK